MSTNIYSNRSLSKLGGLLFARQTPAMATERQNRTESVLESLKAWRERRAAEAELSNMSDRSLADIGLAREDIHDAVRARAARA